jgi:hypothetical protein
MRTGIAPLAVLLALVAASAGGSGVMAAPSRPAPIHGQTERVLDKAAFRARMVETLEGMTPPLKVRIVSDEELVVTGADGVDSRLFLTNAYQQYLNDPPGLEAVLGRFARMITGEGREAELKTGALRVLVRPQGYLDFLRDAARREGKPSTPDDLPLHRALPGGLVALVAQDHPEVYSYPVRSDVRAVVPDDAASWEAALANTRANLGEILTEEAAGGVLIVSTANGFGVSLLLFDEVWDAKALKGRGAPVVAVVDRDTLLLAHEDDRGNVAALGRLIDALSAEPDSQVLTTALLVRRADGRWEVLER